MRRRFQPSFDALCSRIALSDTMPIILPPISCPPIDSNPEPDLTPPIVPPGSINHPPPRDTVVLYVSTGSTTVVQ